MTTIQKIIKYLAIAFAVFLIVSILGGLLSAVGLFGRFFTDDAVLEESREYSISTNIQSLEVQINAADFVIKEADRFLVESNLKYLSVTEKNGVLTIREEKKSSSTYTGAVLTLYVPADTVFEELKLTTGAGKLTAGKLTAEEVKLVLGAGEVNIEGLNALSGADIEGGAGRITIAGGTLNDLEMEMGVGELNLSAVLLGSSELKLGVGQSNLTLLGSRDDYMVDMEKGLGQITVDGKSVSTFENSGNGRNRVEIEGGIGAIYLEFREAGY